MRHSGTGQGQGQGQGTGAAASQEAQTGEAGGEQSEEADGDELIGTDAPEASKPEEGTQLDPGFSVESGSIPEITIEAKQIPDKECFQFVKDMKTGWNLGNTLEAYTCQLKLYFTMGEREKFFQVMQELKQSDVIIDNETLELIRIFS